MLSQEFDQVGPHQGFAAGQAHLAHPQADEGAGHRQEFSGAQGEIAAGEALIRVHAIDAAEVTAVSHRQAQIGDAPAEGVDQVLRR
jgi:hypothetical protein